MPPLSWGVEMHANRSHRRRSMPTGHPEATFLIHGETVAREALAKAVGSGRIERPRMHEEYDI